jgi:hypothetical protein
MTTGDNDVSLPDSTDRDEDPVSSSRHVNLIRLAILSVATAVIHFAVAGEHFQEYWVFGVFMLVSAWLQLTWAVLAVTKPSRLLLLGGAVLNAGIVVVYILTRTVGDMIGPDPKDVEPFGFGDGLCTIIEFVVAVGCVWLLISKSERVVRRQQLFVASATTSALTAILLSVALVDGGGEMVMTMGDDAPAPATTAVAAAQSTMHMAPGSTMKMGTKKTKQSSSGSTMTMTTAASSIHIPTNSPAGDITMPNSSMQMEGGMKMFSSVACTKAPTTSQEAATVKLVNTSWKGIQKFRSLAVAKAAGYVPITPVGQPVVHYVNPWYLHSSLVGGKVFATKAPQFLVYANTPKGAVLAASMYMTLPRNGTVPQPGGCLTQWHVHTNLCTNSQIQVVAVTHAGTCPAGSSNHLTPPMIHVWYIPVPGGPTAIDAPDHQVVRAAEAVKAPQNGTA